MNKCPDLFQCSLFDLGAGTEATGSVERDMATRGGARRGPDALAAGELAVAEVRLRAPPSIAAAGALGVLAAGSCADGFYCLDLEPRLPM